MKKQGRKDVSYWILTFLIALIFILGFLEWRKLELPKAQGETAPAAREKIIVLTFDDGPRPTVLKELLPLLKKYDVKANFFVEGDIAARHKELLKKMHDSGHRIENHGWGHENFVKLYREKGKTAVETSLIHTESVISLATSRVPKYFRPPFWVINHEIEKIIKSLDYKIMKLGNPDINTMDYSDASKKRSVNCLIDRVKNIIIKREQKNIFCHVLVFHELPLSVKALEILIPHFRSRGYRFANLD